MQRVITASEASSRRKIVAGIMDTSEVSVSEAREAGDTCHVVIRGTRK
jgi:hypothetical protein